MLNLSDERYDILESFPPTGVYRSGEKVRATSAVPVISRADVADFMLGVAAGDAHHRRAPGVMY